MALNSICAWCEEKTCQKKDSSWPDWCPQNKGSWLKEALSEYESAENQELYRTAVHIEKAGYREWTRLKEIAEFAEYAGYNKLGLAFCIGLEHEAETVADFFKHKGFKVVSAVCCCGSINKEELGIPKKDMLDPEKDFEAACNPIGQAKLFAECKTDFNIVLGLCVGHDSLFFKYSEAPVTVLAAKDRVLGHNPLAAVYCSQSYYDDLYK